jgi:hypothetical protein
MSSYNSTPEVVDRTSTLSFETVDNASTEALIANRIVLMKAVVPELALDGIRVAFNRSRQRALPRRIAGRLMLESGLGGTMLYKKTRVSDVSANPQRLPSHMRPAQSAVDRLMDLNDAFFEKPEIVEKYGIRRLNLAILFKSDTAEAFGEHQDNQGTTGLALAPQLQPTLWKIHEFSAEDPHPPAPVSFTFTTEVGDAVVLMEREGDCPPSVPFRQGTELYFADGSTIHSGINLTSNTRFGLGLFHQEIAETIQ